MNEIINRKANHMDTDSLSNETYNAVIIEAEKFEHDLTLRFGLLAGHCENEKEYLRDAKSLVNEIKQMDDFDLGMLFFEQIPNKKALNRCLDKIEENIAEVEKKPEEKRHYEF